MELSWMGESRELVRALIYYANMTTRNLSATFAPAHGLELTRCEYQILEYILEFEDETRIMSDISRDLGYVPSVVSKSIGHLIHMGLVEKYRIKGNKKSIVVKPTELGRQIYLELVARDIEPVFRAFIDYIKNLPEGSADRFTEAIRCLCEPWYRFSSSRLEKIEEE